MFLTTLDNLSNQLAIEEIRKKHSIEFLVHEKNYHELLHCNSEYQKYKSKIMILLLKQYQKQSSFNKDRLILT